MGVGGFDLLNLAVGRNFKVAMLTAHVLNPEALKHSMELKARAYLPKEKLGEIVPFLEDMLKYEYLPGWKRLLGICTDSLMIAGQILQKPERNSGGVWQENWQK
jgi:hypothetical protein